MTPELFPVENDSSSDSEEENNLPPKRILVHHKTYSDRYSYGIVLWELASGRIEGMNQYQIAHKVAKG